MIETTRQAKAEWKLPCPLYEEGFSGACENCLQRPECIMLAVLRKVDYLKTRVDTLVSEMSKSRV